MAGAAYRKRPATVPHADAIALGNQLRTSPPIHLLGASLARVPHASGDDLWIGAPSTIPFTPPTGGSDAGSPVDGGAPPDAGAATQDPTAGAALLVRGASLASQASLLLDAMGHPAAAVLFGDLSGSGFGSHIVVGDFDQNGVRDVAIVAARSSTVTIAHDLE